MVKKLIRMLSKFLQRSGVYEAPLKIALIYATIGFLWILLSDRILASVVTDLDTMTRLQSYKGWFYIFLTTGLVYVLVYAQTQTLCLLERVRRESEMRLRQVIDLVPHMIFAKDSNGSYILANQATANAYGMSVDELVGRRHRDVQLEAEEAAQMLADDARVLDTGQPLSIPEETFTDSRGNVRYLTATKIPFTVSGSEQVAILGVAVDITERKVMETQLRQREEVLRLTLDNAPTPIVTFDFEGNVLSANRACCLMLGYTQKQLSGMTFRDFTHTEEITTTEEFLDKARRETLETSSYPGRYVHASGTFMQVILHNGVIHGEDVQPVMLVTQIEDLTARRKAEAETKAHRERLAHIDRRNLMGEMAAGIAHEINQPLTVIANRTSAAHRRIEAGNIDLDKLLHILTKVNEQAHRAGEVIRRLHMLVKEGDSQRELYNINQIVRESLKLAEMDTRIHDIRVNTALNERLPPVVVDSVQIEQVILNLMRNAIDAMEQTPTEDRVIKVVVTERGSDHVEIVIADNGKGITEAVEARLFDAFFSTRDSGMGMGLSISRSIIIAHGGRLWFTRNIDRGCSFHFTLPVAIGEET